MVTGSMLATALLSTLLAPATAAPSAEAGSPPTRPLRAALMVQPGTACLDQDRLASAANAHLQHPEIDARLQVEVTGDDVHPGRVSYRLLRGGDPIFERAFRRREITCEELHAVVGISIALAIDATLVASPPRTADPSPAEPVSERPVVEVAPPLAPAVAEAETVRTSPWALKLAFAGGFLVDMPPRWGGGGAVGVEAAWRDTFDVQIGAMRGGSARIPAGRGRAQLAVTGGRVDVCGGFRWRWLRPRTCAGILVGAARASGQGFSDDRVSRIPWIAVPVGTDLRVRLAPRLEFEFGADAVVHVARPAFDFFDERGVRRAGREFPWIGAAAWLGLVLKVL